MAKGHGHGVLAANVTGRAVGMDVVTWRLARKEETEGS